MTIDKKAPLISISKRANASLKYKGLIRAAAILLSIVIASIIFVCLSKKPNVTIMTFYLNLFKGVFGSVDRLWAFIKEMAFLLIISIVVTPAFKMKFWNIGAEGQVLVGALVTAGCMYKLRDVIPEGQLIFIMLILSICASIIWAVIPAIFKAFWNTNETLFTLMMNYIAMRLVAYFISVWVKSGSGVMGRLTYATLPTIPGMTYLINVIIVAVITILVAVYLKYSKHGYEIEVVGESLNTAKYIGINVKKVIIRTMILSGAVAGVAGFLLVSGDAYTVSSEVVGGRGFTAVLISWLSHFDPVAMVFTSALVAFLEKGVDQVARAGDLGQSFAEISTSITFFAIILCEFFINYKIKFRKTIKDVVQEDKNIEPQQENVVQEATKEVQA